MSSFELRRCDFESFFNTPSEVYPKEFGFVSVLKSDLKRFLDAKNPLFKDPTDFEYWTCLEDGKIVGRILAHIHRESNAIYKCKRCYFGYLDCVNRKDVAQALLQKAEEFAKKKGQTELIGNFNMTAMQAIGVVTKLHRQEHYSDQVYAPEYISELLKQLGYKSIFPMLTHEVDLEKFDPESLFGPKQKAILQDPQYQFLDLKKRAVKPTIEIMRHCLNEGFIDNPMFVPLSWDEIYFQAKDMMLIIDRHISSIVEYKGEPVGAIVCIPNLNPFLSDIGSRFGLSTPYYFLKQKLRRDSAVIIYYSVVKKYHALGLNGAMLYRTMRALKDRGYKRLGGTWIACNNTASLRQAEKLGAQVLHELCLYSKDLTDV